METVGELMKEYIRVTQSLDQQIALLQRNPAIRPANLSDYQANLVIGAWVTRLRKCRREYDGIISDLCSILDVAPIPADQVTPTAPHQASWRSGWRK